MFERVELASPNGHVYRSGDRGVLAILNGAQGRVRSHAFSRDGEDEIMTRVEFDDLPDTIVSVPSSWVSAMTLPKSSDSALPPVSREQDWREAARVRLDLLDAAITRYGEAVKDESQSVVAARANVCDAIMDLCEKVASVAALRDGPPESACPYGPEGRHDWTNEDRRGNPVTPPQCAYCGRSAEKRESER